MDIDAECQFNGNTKGSKCRICGYQLRTTYELPLVRTCPGGPCRHLGNPTGETVAVKCLTCQKTQTLTHYPINHCNLFGECLPTYRCTKDAISESMHSTIAVCRGCEKFEASSPIIMETDPTTTRT